MRRRWRSISPGRSASRRERSLKPCVESCIPKILRLQDGRPVLSIEEKEAAEGGCIECLACELACEFHGKRGLHISLPLPDVKDK